MFASEWDMRIKENSENMRRKNTILKKDFRRVGTFDEVKESENSQIKLINRFRSAFGILLEIRVIKPANVFWIWNRMTYVAFDFKNYNGFRIAFSKIYREDKNCHDCSQFFSCKIALCRIFKEVKFVLLPMTHVLAFCCQESNPLCNNSIKWEKVKRLTLNLSTGLS